MVKNPGGSGYSGDDLYALMGKDFSAAAAAVAKAKSEELSYHQRRFTTPISNDIIPLVRWLKQDLYGVTHFALTASSIAYRAIKTKLSIKTIQRVMRGLFLATGGLFR